MATSFLHGVETKEVDLGGQNITVVKSSVIALFGIAPTGPTNQLTMCISPTYDAQFGSQLNGFNIPKTLGIIRKFANNAVVLVVNIFNPTTHTSQVTDEVQVVANGMIKLAYNPIGAVTIKNSDGTPSTLVPGTDFSINEFGKLIALSSNVPDALSLKFSYKKLNQSALASSDLIGTTNGDGTRTGLQLFDLAMNTFGFTPKIIIAPQYASIAAIASQMFSMAAKFRAIPLIDAPYGTTVVNAISSRGVSGSVVFNNSNPRAYLLYPYLKSYDVASDSNLDYPYSAFMAGNMVKTDSDEGYWVSPSNHDLSIAAIGTERTIEWNLNNSGTEANLLNAAGITTVGTGFGTGILAWGNRSAAFPTVTNPTNFINIRRTMDMVEESLELASLAYIDKPLNQAIVDTIREDGNTFMRALIQRGACLPGSRIEFDPANAGNDFANGKAVFQPKFAVPAPLEWLTYEVSIDTSLYSNLK